MPKTEGMMAKRKAKKKPAKRKPVRQGEIIALNMIALGLRQRVERIEHFLGDDLKLFHDKQPEPDTPETAGAKAKQAKDIMTKLAAAAGDG
jgi:hypothetical protein